MIQIVTPTLAIGEHATRLFDRASTPAEAARLIVSGKRALVPDEETARATLARCGVSEAQAEYLLDNALDAEPVESVV